MEEENVKNIHEDDSSGLLTGKENYLESGVHIGTKVKNNDMKDFIFKIKENTGVYILDISKTDDRLRKLSNLLSKYDPSEVLVVASRVYSSSAASKFSKLTGIQLMKGRFTPGSMTNLKTKTFREPSILFVCDPRGERQAISEAAKVGIPIVALCDTDNETRFLDFIIPVNNKGKKSLALVFYLLSREIMLKQGKISNYSDFKFSPQYFEQLEDF
ncbi:MAG: 30S ribosomal protein S2 [Candidatus ainarchaeum sp.]|nr:30S ribosomal protein S2 [Candidatus ainarchaeum sp.]